MTTTTPGAPGDAPPTITPSPASPVPPATSPRLSTRLTPPVLMSAAAVAVVVVGSIGLVIGVLLSNDSDSTKVTIPGINTPGTAAPGQPVSTVTLGNGIVNVPVPAGWERLHTDDKNGVFLQHDVAKFFINLGHGATDASALATSSADGLLVGDSQVQRAAVSALSLKGTIVSAALVNYTGLDTSTGTSASVQGGFFGFIRKDGTAMLVWVECRGATPQDAAAAVNNDPGIGTIINGAVNDFGSR